MVVDGPFSPNVPVPMRFCLARRRTPARAAVSALELCESMLWYHHLRGVWAPLSAAP